MGMALSVPKYSVADLDLLPEDGNRYEILAGVLLVTPSPGMAHQGVAARLSILFAPHAVAKRLQFYAPGVVKLPPFTQLEPDFLVMPQRFVPGGNWEDVTENWLAVEVLSRSSRVYDREFKRDAYIALGVREVWLVDIRNRYFKLCVTLSTGAVVMANCPCA